jgi:hypothetical protein
MNFSSKTLMPFLSITLLLAACQKGVSVKEQITTVNSETSSGVTAANEFPDCKLRRISHFFSDSDGPSVSGVFTYNKAGNPISLLYNNNGTGNPNHYWLYDNQNRLSEWRKTYQNGTIIIERHRYVYNANGPAVRDTAMFIEGDTITNVYTFTYDSLGRIVKENIKNIKNANAPLNPQRNPTYTYDNNGNLSVIGWKPSTYDKNPNPLRTSSVFQFVLKNWSRTNCMYSPHYNSKGLPDQLQNGNDIFFNVKKNIFFAYDCQ